MAKHKYNVGDTVFFSGFTVASKATIMELLDETHPEYKGRWAYNILLWKDEERFAQTEDATLFWPCNETELTDL